MIQMQNDHPEYISCVGVPFHVHVFSREQINLVKYFPNQPLHLDSTGSIIRKVNDGDKRVYYYSGVIQIDTFIK